MSNRTYLAYAYGRKSILINNMSKEDSVNYQKSTIEEYANQHNIYIEKFFSDVGYSGKNTDRPDLQEMLQCLKTSKKKIDYLLFYSVDRLGRDFEANITTVLEITSFVKKIVFVTEGLVSDAEHFKPLFLLYTAIAQSYRENLLVNLSNGRRAKVLGRKSFNGSIIPLGYTKEKGKKGSQKLLPATSINTDNFEEMQGLLIVQHIFHCFLFGISLRGIAKSLNRHFGTTRRNAAWDGTSVRYVLENVVYTGNLKGVLDGSENYLIEKANVFPIVDPLLFEFISHRMKHNCSGRKRQTLFRQPHFTICKTCLEMLHEKRDKLICLNCKTEVAIDLVSNKIIEESLKLIQGNIENYNWSQATNNSLVKFKSKRTKLIRNLIILQQRRAEIDILDFSNSKKQMIEANSKEICKYQQELLIFDELINNIQSLSEKEIENFSKQKISHYLLKLPYLILIDFNQFNIDILFHKNSLLNEGVGIIA